MLACGICIFSISQILAVALTVTCSTVYTLKSVFIRKK